MALLNDIIKKYEAQAKERLAEVHSRNNPQPAPQSSVFRAASNMELLCNSSNNQILVAEGDQVQVSEPAMQDDFSRSVPDLVTELRKLRAENAELRKRLGQ